MAPIPPIEVLERWHHDVGNQLYVVRMIIGTMEGKEHARLKHELKKLVAAFAKGSEIILTVCRGMHDGK